MFGDLVVRAWARLTRWMITFVGTLVKLSPSVNRRYARGFESGSSPSPAPQSTQLHEMFNFFLKLVNLVPCTSYKIVTSKMG